MKQIYNLGVFGKILKIIKESGTNLSDKNNDRLEYLESLPKNQWIDLDDNGKMISKEKADLKFNKHLSKFKIINNDIE